MTDTKNKEFHAIVVAAGTGSRFGTQIPKQFITCAGKPLIIHSLEKLQKIDLIKTVTVVINPDHIDLYDDAVKTLKCTNKIQPPVMGGKSRTQSSFNGISSVLKKSNSVQIAVIHDAARPNFSAKILANTLTKIQSGEFEAATFANMSTDTLVRQNDQRNYGENIKREGIWHIQTPQILPIHELTEAIKNNKNEATDDASILAKHGHKVTLIDSDKQNIKLTHPNDINFLENILMGQTQYVQITGSGFDVHAFDQDKSVSSITLGGIEIPHNMPLTAHSDGDLVLHALCDAIYGALGKEDIGHHFPPSDLANKGKNSIDFLIHAKECASNQDTTILHVDITVIGEAPKIGPHRPAMKKRIASILEITENHVSIKATTTEKLGFTGRQEGLACQATVTINCKREIN